ncbi:unnamed protein product [Blepharisma stoltei]|uniref:EF-hand domain-containing protein n=1 Tax=Blepharisma stoltei TaxID=1481888 RepID=A0AAU9JLC9_9CILI|nr:unnamed protein product [Blepharisma stoltei]
MDRIPMKLSSRTLKGEKSNLSQTGTSMKLSYNSSNYGRHASDYQDKEFKIPRERFNPIEIKRLRTDYRKFCNKMEIMTRRAFLEFFKIEELEGTLIGDRLYTAFALQGSIDFEKFLNAVGVLCKGSLDERLQLVFKIFDVKNANVIDRSDLKRILLSILNSMLEVEMDSAEVQNLQMEVHGISPQEREEAIDGILNDIITPNSGDILTPEEFCNFIGNEPLLRKILEGA